MEAHFRPALRLHIKRHISPSSFKAHKSSFPNEKRGLCSAHSPACAGFMALLWARREMRAATSACPGRSLSARARSHCGSIYKLLINLRPVHKSGKRAATFRVLGSGVRGRSLQTKAQREVIFLTVWVHLWTFSVSLTLLAKCRPGNESAWGFNGLCSTVK